MTRFGLIITTAVLMLTASAYASPVTYTSGDTFTLSSGLLTSHGIADYTTSINASVAESLLVTSLTELTLGWRFAIGSNGPTSANCVLGDPSGTCFGLLNDSVTISGNGVNDFVSFSGHYSLGHSASNGLEPSCNFGAGVTCDVFLQPGFYTLTVNLSDGLSGSGSSAATVLPFNEEFIGVVSLHSGSIQVDTLSTPEPSSFALVLLSLFGFFALCRVRGAMA